MPLNSSCTSTRKTSTARTTTTTISVLEIGDKITIGTQSAILTLRPAYFGGGVWQLFVDAWPALVNGEYLVKVERV